MSDTKAKVDQLVQKADDYLTRKIESLQAMLALPCDIRSGGHKSVAEEPFYEVLEAFRTDCAIERQEWQDECERRSKEAKTEAKRAYWLARAYSVRLVK
jgi:hypothetical protein